MNPHVKTVSANRNERCIPGSSRGERNLRTLQVQIARKREESARLEAEASELQQQATDEMAQLTEEEQTADLERRRQIGRRIQALRKERDLSQPELADMIGVAIRTLQHWEAGTKDIDRYKGNVKAVAQALDVDEQWVRYGDDGTEDLMSALARDGAGMPVSLGDALDMVQTEFALLSERLDAGLTLVEENNRLLRQVLQALLPDPGVRAKLNGLKADQATAQAARKAARRGRRPPQESA